MPTATPPTAPAVVQRTRIDGALSRSLPVTLSVRATADGAPDDGLLRLRLSVSSEAPYLRHSWWEDPWIEVLGHADGEIDLSRLNGGATVLANHNRYSAVGNTALASIGAVERAWVEGARLHADIVLSRRDALADLRQDIADNLIRNVSIGYTVNERVLTRVGADSTASEYRVTKWEPFEISLVDIPADAGVGLGRSAPETTHTPAPHYRVVDLPTLGATQGAAMPTTTAPAEVTANQSTAPAQASRAADIQVTGTDHLAVERARAREILALGRQFDMADLADSAVDVGMSLDQFRTQVLSRVRPTEALRRADSPEIGMSDAEVQQFSFTRAMLAAADPLNAARIAPFEMEASRAAQDKRGDSRDKIREAALTIPADVLSRGLRTPADMAMSAARMLSSHHQARSRAGHDAYYRDLLAGTPTAGGNTIATELLGSSFIDLLRNAMVLDRLGATFLRDLNGNLAIPSQTGGATGYWVAENNPPTESQQTTGQVALTPKTVGAYTDYSRRLLLQSSIDVELFVRADLAATLAQMIQSAAINGPAGSGTEPCGILNTVGIGSVAGGTTGLAPAYSHVVDLETAVSNANADLGSLAYLTNSKVRGTLRKTQEFSGTNGRPVWTSGAERGIGEVLGYEAAVSNSVPSNLTKSSSVGICSALIFGNWADLIIGMWGGLDIMLDPYAGATSGTKRVIALQDVDVAARRVASFAAMKDALTS